MSSSDPFGLGLEPLEAKEDLKTLNSSVSTGLLVDLDQDKDSPRLDDWELLREEAQNLAGQLGQQHQGEQKEVQALTSFYVSESPILSDWTMLAAEANSLSAAVISQSGQEGEQKHNLAPPPMDNFSPAHNGSPIVAAAEDEGQAILVEDSPELVVKPVMRVDQLLAECREESEPARKPPLPAACRVSTIKFGPHRKAHANSARPAGAISTPKSRPLAVKPPPGRRSLLPSNMTLQAKSQPVGVRDVASVRQATRATPLPPKPSLTTPSTASKRRSLLATPSRTMTLMTTTGRKENEVPKEKIQPAKRRSLLATPLTPAARKPIAANNAVTTPATRTNVGPARPSTVGPAKRRSMLATPSNKPSTAAKSTSSVIKPPLVPSSASKAAPRPPGLATPLSRRPLFPSTAENRPNARPASAMKPMLSRRLPVDAEATVGPVKPGLAATPGHTGRSRYSAIPSPLVKR